MAIDRTPPSAPGEMAQDNLQIALAAAENGYVAVPCFPGTKIPCVKWKRWQHEMPAREQIEEWFADTRCNIGILTTGLVVFDCDDPAKAELVLSHCGETSHKVKTPRGIHLGYRKRKGVIVKNLTKIKDQAIDLRSDGGLEMIPNSVTGHGRYEWLGEGLKPKSELPVAKIGWTRTRTQRRSRNLMKGHSELPEGKGRIKNPEAYCLHIESIQGQNGSRGLVRVICILRDAGRTPEQIFQFIFNVWGPRCCQPEWSEREVWYAIHRYCGFE